MECGSWKNFDDLEDSLTLEELSELYEMATDRQFRQMQMMAAVAGVELEDPRDEQNAIRGSADLVGIPFNLGYETV